MRRLALLAAAVIAFAACKHAAPPSSPPATELTVPRAHGAFDFDGEIEEAEWHSAARTGQLTDVDREKPVRPYSDARVLYDGSNLLLALYAADENVVAAGGKTAVLASDDQFVVRAAGHEIRINPAGAIRGDVPGIRVGVDLDGTINDRSDMDEEWVVEASIPLAGLGVRTTAGLAFQVSRCDVTLDGWRACGAWPAKGDGFLRFAP